MIGKMDKVMEVQVLDLCLIYPTFMRYLRMDIVKRKHLQCSFYIFLFADINWLSAVNIVKYLQVK